MLALIGVGMLVGYLFSPIEYKIPVQITISNRVSGFLVLATFTMITNKLIQSRKRYRRISEELAIANRELESFSYSAAHDLRAPLRAMKGLSQILLEEHGGNLNETGISYLQMIKKSAERMSSLIDDLLSLSRISLQQITMEDVDISQLAAAVLSEFQKSSPGRNAQVSIAPDLMVRADARLMRIALTNLLGNAWKYTSKKDTTQIEFGIAQVRGTPAYFIKDNGVGFNMDNAQKLFSPFQRLHTESEFPGTGIGLSIVARIIQKHGGSVWAQSRPGEGATFYFTLPRRD